MRGESLVQKQVRKRPILLGYVAGLVTVIFVLELAQAMGWLPR